MSTMRRAHSVLLSIAVSQGNALFARTAFAQVPTPMPKVVLVELFTSEGCSSCPPADQLLREIHGTHTAAGQLIVGLSEHVTYWTGWDGPIPSLQKRTASRKGTLPLGVRF